VVNLFGGREGRKEEGSTIEYRKNHLATMDRIR